MTVRWMVIMVLLIAVAIGYLAVLNPVPVKIALPLLGTFHPTTGWLAILAFGVGILCALIFFAIRDWQEYFARLSEKKKEKLAKIAHDKLLRAGNYLRIGLEDLSLATARDAQEKNPLLAEAHELAGDIAARRGDFYAAAANHNQGLAVDRNHDRIRAKLAQDYHRAGNSAMALRVLKEGLELHERNPFLLATYRDLLSELKNWDGAIAAQSKLGKIKDVRLQDDYRHTLAGLHYEKGKALLSEGKPEDACREFEEAVKLDPLFAPAYIKGGDAYLAYQKDKSALKIWALGYRRISDQAIMDRLEAYYLEHNEPSRIINLYLRHIEEKPQNADIRLHFAHLLFKLEMHQEAHNQIEEVRRIKGDDDAEAAYLAFLLKERAEDAQGALNELKIVVASKNTVGRFSCASCRQPLTERHDRCPACGRWGTVGTAS